MYTGLAKEIAAEERKRYERELERLETMTEEQRETERHRTRIVEDILNLKLHVPGRCKLVFVDFSNCAALTCANADCGAAFCAWCQKDCGDDAHIMSM